MIDTLQKIINTLNLVDTHGQDNLERLYISLVTLEQLKQQLIEQQAAEEGEHGD